MPRRSEHDPADDAPPSGRYELLNTFDTPAGGSASATEGERLPAVPPGYSWRLVAVDEPLELARPCVLVAEKRISRPESLVRQMEHRGHVEIAKVGRDTLRVFQGTISIREEVSI